MSRSRLPLSLAPLTLALSFTAGSAAAQVPNVVADIAPVHSLVARVMQDVGTPDLIIPPGASPHEYALRPSQAAALQEADVVVWIGHGLTPWLEGAVETLAENATALELSVAEGTTMLAFREGALFEAHDHDDHASDHGEEGHDDHDDHADHGDHEDQDDHDEAAHHDHAGEDPHAWLSPQNAATWLTLIASQLAEADPENADAYRANAAAGRDEIDRLVAEINTTLDPVRDARFIVFHDAYQYFENSFGIGASGAISLSDATDPSPARIAQIQERIARDDIACVLAEPQFNAGVVDAVMGGTTAKTGVLDPLGADLTPGPALYPQLLRNLAAALAGCL